MARRLGGVANLARVALIAGVVTGCTGPGSPSLAATSSPSVAAPTGGAAAPTPSPATPTLAPTLPSQHVEITWAIEPELVELNAWHITVGPAGPVVAGNCKANVGRQLSCPTAWSLASDGGWVAHPLPHDGPVTQVEALSGGSAGYVIVGHDRGYHDREAPPPDSAGPQVIWRSVDGVSWEKIGTVDIGECCPFWDGSGEPYGIWLAPSGALLAGLWVDEDKDRRGPYVSDDARTWTLVEPSAFGPALESFVPGTGLSTPSALMLAGGSRNATDGIWSTENGRTWTRVVGVSEPGSVGMLAADQDRLVASFRVCRVDGDFCPGEVWSLDAAGSWDRRIATGQPTHVGLVFTGSAFVGMYGVEGDRTTALASLDGVTWMDLGIQPLLSREESGFCGVEELVAWQDTILANGCGTWVRGTVRVRPGAGEPLDPEEPNSSPPPATPTPTPR